MKESAQRNKKHVIVGNYLREKRIAAGLTQREVSETLGYTTPQYLSNIERGNCPPSPEIIKAIPKLYKIDPKELVMVFLDGEEELLNALFTIKKKKTSSAR